MRLKVLYHGNCFDGCASAALFGRFFVEREGARLDAVSFFPLHHQQGDPFPGDAFDADVNACVDFRFSASPALHWWFDHHASAFPSPADRAAFERDRSGQKFWDPAAPSCTGFMARTLAARFGWRAGDLDDLVAWADLGTRGRLGVTVGPAWVRAKGSAQSLIYTEYHMGGHSTAFDQDYRVSFDFPADALGLDLGGFAEVALGRHAGLRLDARYCWAPEKDAEVSVRDIVNPGT